MRFLVFINVKIMFGFLNCNSSCNFNSFYFLTVLQVIRPVFIMLTRFNRYSARLYNNIKLL